MRTVISDIPSLFRTSHKHGSWVERLANVNRELWLLLSMFMIAALLNWLVASQGIILGFYTLPTIFSAYVYGRRHAVMTAMASILLVIILLKLNPELAVRTLRPDQFGPWMDVLVWGCLLNITAYAMGSLYERKERNYRELRRTYFGILTILQQFISNDKYTHNHSYRVAMYASSIATHMRLDENRVDDIRAAGLLHDIGKLETSREILHKAAALTDEETVEMRDHVRKGGAFLEPMSGSLGRILPIILAHHEKFDGTGYEETKGQDIPLEARILSLADAYDTLTSDRPYRRAVTPFEAKEIIIKGAGRSFDPKVVDAFVAAFDERQMDLPESVMMI